MKYSLLIFILSLISCSQNHNTADKKTPNKASSPKDAIPEIRSVVRKNPVASYLVPMGDARLERNFGVTVYETPQTFKYLLEMQYDGMIETDTIKVPNIERWPVIQVKPGKEKFSCIIGFLDDKDNFREYKLLSAQNDHLSLTVLKSYGIVSN